LKIAPLPQAEEPDRQQQNREPELVPGSARFRKDLESLAGIATGEPELDEGETVFGKEDAPKVKFRTGKTGDKEASQILLDVDKILGGLEAENVLDGIESDTELLSDPSILDLYRQRLVEHYGFSTDDPVFALCEIFDEVQGRDATRRAASEEFCRELVGKGERALAGLGEKAATVEKCLNEQQALRNSVLGLGRLVERVEEVLLTSREELAARGASLALVQQELEREVHQSLQRGLVERLLMSVILVAVLVVGLLVGSHFLK
jgi:hypothetical protein